jgi:hypothetical protein
LSKEGPADTIIAGIFLFIFSYELRGVSSFNVFKLPIKFLTYISLNLFAIPMAAFADQYALSKFSINVSYSSLYISA